MKRFLLTFITSLFFMVCAFSQSKKTNPFQRVAVPDSIVVILEGSYNKNAMNVNAGKNVFNLLNRKDIVFKDGIFSFQGQGPHFPRRIFIYNKGNIFIFEYEGAYNARGIIEEYSLCIKKLNLTEMQIVRYTKAISDYLCQEEGNTYGSEIKK